MRRQEDEGAKCAGKEKKMGKVLRGGSLRRAFSVMLGAVLAFAILPGMALAGENERVVEGIGVSDKWPLKFGCVGVRVLRHLRRPAGSVSRTCE